MSLAQCPPGGLGASLLPVTVAEKTDGSVQLQPGVQMAGASGQSQTTSSKAGAWSIIPERA